ncbi:cytochrome c [Planctomycetes bacterium K23_9]|uniref:Cytochrome c n=1 Tax=Stieleria marina TaxID=1930275 RepID=A0A517NPG1_9BACT|nr:Cytochrome c [Planctomycetes bacterium K23_9]
MRPVILLCLLLAIGCDAAIDQFPANDVYALTLAHSRDVRTELAQRDVAEVIRSLFGTPESPVWPSEIFDGEAKSLVKSESLTAAAGPIFSDREGNNFGLFNKHCVACHGVSGSGAGPAAVFQNPYPRDFQAGVFKWKSTERSAKPTRDDLVGLLHRGVKGTGMPSFALVSEADVSALTDYLVYLSVRGEAERKLLAFAIDELGYDDSEDDSSEFLIEDADVHQIVGEIVESWLDASKRGVPVPKEVASNTDSIARGKDLFHGQIANCVGCHGPGGNGAAVTLDFDDWAKEYSSRIGLTPTNRDAMKPFRQAGALRPRQIKPRQLNQGVLRGAGDGKAIYRQISQGIAGTPMPSLTITKQESATGLTSDQVWDLVHYVQSLGSQPGDTLP